MKRNRLIVLFLIALSFVDIKEAKALTKFEQNYDAFQKLFEGNKSCAYLVAVYDQLRPAIKVLNEGAYRCHAIFSINGEMKEPITDIYVKSMIHFYPGQGKNANGPYKREKVFSNRYLKDKVCINICLKDCSQEDLTIKDNIYYKFIMSIIHSGEDMVSCGDSVFLKEVIEVSFGKTIAENWEEVEGGDRALIVTKEMMLNENKDAVNIVKEKFLNNRNKFIESMRKKTIEIDNPNLIASLLIGNTLVIILESNKSTGYEWQLAEPIDTNMIEFVESKYEASDTNSMGSSGKEKWTFKASGAGETKVSFKYLRPWEKDVSPAKEAVFNVIIRP